MLFLPPTGGLIVRNVKTNGQRGGFPLGILLLFCLSSHSHTVNYYFAAGHLPVFCLFAHVARLHAHTRDLNAARTLSSQQRAFLHSQLLPACVTQVHGESGSAPTQL